MEVEDIQSQPAHKFSSRIIATTNNGQLISAAKLPHHFPPGEDADDDDGGGVGGANKRQAAIVSNAAAAAIEAVNNGGANRLRGWHHSSRIIRVSRASGGKDRHSKVWTSKGLRDRRVRLSVTTAIQFYDLQDRLRFDQPSKAVEWLINAAAEAISELPSLNSSACFPDTPKQLSDEKRGAFDSAADAAGIDDNSAGFHHHQQLSLSKSACSSTSETSKGSGLSLSRPDAKVNRVKARERARERAAKDKEKESSGDNPNPNPNPNPNNMNSIGQNSSFTELLTSGINNVNNNNNNNNSSGGGSPVTVAQMDYFATGLLNLSSTPSTTVTSSRPHQHHQIHMGNSSLSLPMTVPMPFGLGLISGSGDVASSESMHHHFPFVPEQHMFPIASAAASSDYSLNFSIGGGIAGFNRGTLQSNSSQQHSIYNNHHHHHNGLQRFSNPAIDHVATAANNSSIPLFFGTAAPQPMEHQFAAGFDGRLQLCYGDGTRHPDPNKGKGKN